MRFLRGDFGGYDVAAGLEVSGGFRNHGGASRGSLVLVLSTISCRGVVFRGRRMCAAFIFGRGQRAEPSAVHARALGGLDNLI